MKPRIFDEVAADDIAGDEEFTKLLDKGTLDFDVLIATPAYMPPATPGFGNIPPATPGYQMPSMPSYNAPNLPPAGMAPPLPRQPKQ